MGNESRDQGEVSKAKECHRLLAKHQKLGESDEQILSSQHSEEPNPADILISDLYLQNRETIHFCFLHLLKLVVFHHGSPTKLFHLFPKS